MVTSLNLPFGAGSQFASLSLPGDAACRYMSTDPSGSGGVGTAMKITSDFSTPSAVLLVKLSRPAPVFSFTRSSRPGS